MVNQPSDRRDKEEGKCRGGREGGEKQNTSDHVLALSAELESQSDGSTKTKPEPKTKSKTTTKRGCVFVRIAIEGAAGTQHGRGEAC